MHVREVLETLRKEQLYANLPKCMFALDYIEFLGFVLSSKGVHVDFFLYKMDFFLRENVFVFLKDLLDYLLLEKHMREA